MPKPRIAISWGNARRSTDPGLDENALRAAVAGFVAELGYAGWGVSLLLADDPTLHELNRGHRGRDAPTDVLSWSYLEAPQAGPSSPAPVSLPRDSAEDAAGPGEEMLGDLAISLERAQAQARTHGWELRTEVLRLLAHGCAHLAGYDHQSPEDETAMHAVEVRLLAVAGLEGIYPE